MRSELHILMLEDQAADAELILRELRKEDFDVTSQRVLTEADFGAGLRNPDLNLILADYSLPAYDGLSALALARQQRLEVPFIFVTGTLGEETAINALHQGATDVVLKQRLARLGSSVTRALREVEERDQRQRVERALRESEDQFRAIFELNAIGMAQANPRTGQWLRVNQKMCAITGYSAAELLQMRIPDITHPDEREADWEEFQRGVRGDAPEYRREKRYVRKDGSVAWVNVNVTVLRDATGQPARTLATVEDITGRKQAEERVADALLYNETLLQTSPIGIMTYRATGQAVSANPAVARMFGATPEQLTAQNFRHLKSWKQSGLLAAAEAALASGQTQHMETHHLSTFGQARWLSCQFVPFQHEGQAHLLGQFTDVTERKRAEEGLQQSEEKYRALFESAQDAIMTAAPPDWRFTGGNPAAIAMFRASNEAEFCSTAPWQVSPECQPDGEPSADQARRMIETAMAQGMHAFEWVHRRLTGELFPAAVILVRMQRGSETLLQATVRDITEQKQSEQALRASETKFRSYIESAPLGVFISNRLGRYDEVNEAAARMTGWSPLELRSLSIPDLLAPSSLADGRANFETLTQEGSSTGEFLLRRKDGTDFWASLHAIKLDEDRFMAFCQDISQRKEAEKTLRLSERFVRGTLDALSAHVCVLDEKGEIVTVNRAWRDFAIANPPVLINVCEGANYLAVCDLAPPEYAEQAAAMAQAIRRVARGEQMEFTIEYPCHAPDEKRWFIGRVTRFADEGPVRVVVAHENITDRKRGEEEHAIMQVQVNQAQKLESIGRLAAGIAHEINTPTQYVGDNVHFFHKAFTDLDRVLEAHLSIVAWLREQGPIPQAVTDALAPTEKVRLDFLRQEIPKAITDAQEGVERVTRIVRAMKDFSHPGTEEKRPVDLNRAIETTLTVARNEWKYVAELVTDFETELPPVPCLPGEFNQVILNLVVNAAHAIGDVVGDGQGGKGTLTVSTRRREDWVEVRIQDTGTGIPEKARAHIFEPFFTTKAVGKGTGQGLALAHSVIKERHGGTLTFETETGQGTTFIIRLPLPVRTTNQAPPKS